MRRPRPLVSLLLAQVLFAALALAPFSPLVPTPRACPVSPPVPLRMLYKRSERVVVATVGASSAVEKQEQFEKVRTLLHVSESLKGEGEPAFQLQRNVWTGGDDEGEKDDTFEPGNTLLLFLSKGGEGGSYVASDPVYGVKNLPEADLKIYVERIKELAALTRQEKPDDAGLVEWLVRCAEEEATRWEGAYELLVSAVSLPELKKRQAETEAKAAREKQEAAGATPADAARADAEQRPEAKTGDASSATVEVAATPSAAPTNGARPLVQSRPLGLLGTDIEESHAELLTAEQKARLSDALYAAEEITEGELLLAGLVGKLGDERLVPFLLERLRRGSDDSHMTVTRMMHLVARLRDSQELKSLAESFGKMDGYYLVELEYAAEEAAAGEVTDGAASGGPEADAEMTDEEAAAAEAEEETERARYMARVEAAEKVAASKRAELLRQFLSLADAQLAKR